MTAPLNNLTDTWNNSGTTFTGLKYNITNTASAAASRYFDFQVGGNSFFYANADGSIFINQLFGGVSAHTLDIKYQGNTTFQVDYNAIVNFFGDIAFQTNSYKINWGGGAQLQSDASYIMAQRNSTNAQTLRVYNTYTDASNYERGVFDWTTTSNVLIIGAQAAGTGTLRMSAHVAFQKAGAAVAGDLPSGTFAVVRDTSGATTKLVYNNAGTLMTVALT